MFLFRSNFYDYILAFVEHNNRACLGLDLINLTKFQLYFSAQQEYLTGI